MAAHFENRDYMVGVLFRFQVEDERRKAENAQCGRGKNSTFETRRSPFMQNMFRRTCRVTKIVRQLIQETLYAIRRP